MLAWNNLTDIAQVNAIQEKSHQIPCVIFKHSTRCSISTTAKARLERNWQFGADDVHAYYVDLLNHRELSNQLAAVFAVHHESPQVLLIIKGECVYDESHNAISVADLATEIQRYV